MFVLFNMIIAFVLGFIDGMLGLTIGSGAQAVGVLGLIYSLAMLIPGLAVCVRRLHDIGKSGWYVLIALIPIIGGIWLLVLMCKEGDMANNEYGPNPKLAEAA